VRTRREIGRDVASAGVGDDGAREGRVGIHDDDRDARHDAAGSVLYLPGEWAAGGLGVKGSDGDGECEERRQNERETLLHQPLQSDREVDAAVQYGYRPTRRVQEQPANRNGPTKDGANTNPAGR